MTDLFFFLNMMFKLYSGLKNGQITGNRLLGYLDEIHGTPSVNRACGGL